MPDFFTLCILPPYLLYAYNASLPIHTAPLLYPSPQIHCLLLRHLVARALLFSLARVNPDASTVTFCRVAECHLRLVVHWGSILEETESAATGWPDTSWCSCRAPVAISLVLARPYSLSTSTCWLRLHLHHYRNFNIAGREWNGGLEGPISFSTVRCISGVKCPKECSDVGLQDMAWIYGTPGFCWNPGTSPWNLGQLRDTLLEFSFKRVFTS